MADPYGNRRKRFTAICWAQGGYYLITGVWPLVHIRSFLWVTGDKNDNLPSGERIDHWLVMTVGVLITAIAVAILVSAYRQSAPIEVAVLAITAALGLTGIDVFYTWRGMILPVYLIDAAIEIALAVAWCCWVRPTT